ncbi:hypothetical protein SL1157_0063 [Ruegeria lacuscaerulensis ITI-1157]|nr:hypothetical protein SL1157_0063 [Ruegeria lacuscaerulensis ITI-1157]
MVGRALEINPAPGGQQFGKERYSLPYFAVPRHDIEIAPLLPPIPGFDRPAVHCGHWSAETWRTNWPDEPAGEDAPELGTLTD